VKVTRSMCPWSEKRHMLLAANNRSIRRQPEITPRRGNCRGRRRSPTGGGSGRQTDTSVCTPLARSACSGLVTTSTCPSHGSPGCALGKLAPSAPRTRLPGGIHRRKSTHRPTLRAQPSRRITEGLKRLYHLIRWLGGLQGWRTAVRDAERNSALKDAPGKKKKKKKKKKKEGLPR